MNATMEMHADPIILAILDNKNPVVGFSERLQEVQCKSKSVHPRLARCTGNPFCLGSFIQEPTTKVQACSHHYIASDALRNPCCTYQG